MLLRWSLGVGQIRHAAPFASRSVEDGHGLDAALPFEVHGELDRLHHVDHAFIVDAASGIHNDKEREEQRHEVCVRNQPTLVVLVFLVNLVLRHRLFFLTGLGWAFVKSGVGEQFFA